jgi:hypothetical protein
MLEMVKRARTRGGEVRQCIRFPWARPAPNARGSGRFDGWPQSPELLINPSDGQQA